MWRVARGRICYVGVERAHGHLNRPHGDNAFNDGAIHNHDDAFDGAANDLTNNDAHNAECKSVHARARYDYEWSAGAGYGKSNVADWPGQPGHAESGNDPAIDHMSANDRRNDQSELRAGDSADNTALIRRVFKERRTT